MRVNFAHLADLHLGSWREKKLTELNLKTFRLAIDKIIEERLEFCLFSGDIFNHAMPPIELVTAVVSEFMRLKNRGIRTYVIGGSHDYSYSGKSFLDLLDEAGVFVNVVKYELVGKDKYKLIKTIDEKTNTCIYGILGKKKELEKSIYKNLEKIELDNNSFNVFMFHSTLDDLKPDFMKNVKVEINSSYLPKGFNYYAGGHIHTFIKANYDKGLICYPGALFPNNFSELKIEEPSFNICSYDDGKLELRRVKLDVYTKQLIKIDLDKLNSNDAKNKILDCIESHDIDRKIILLELSGSIEGKVSDIGLNNIVAGMYDKDCFVVLKNTSRLKSALFEISDDTVSENIEELENELIKNNLKDSTDKEREYKLIKQLLNLDLNKLEDEKVNQYEMRVREDVENVLKN